MRRKASRSLVDLPDMDAGAMSQMASRLNKKAAEMKSRFGKKLALNPMAKGAASTAAGGKGASERKAAGGSFRGASGGSGLPEESKNRLNNIGSRFSKFAKQVRAHARGAPPDAPNPRAR